MTDADQWQGIPLHDDEYIITEITESSFWTLATGLTLIVVFSVFTYGLALIGLPFLLMLHQSIKRKKYAVTNQRILIKTGLFHRQEYSIDLSLIHDVRINRPALFKNLRTGSVRIKTSTNKLESFSIKRQADPDTVASYILMHLAA